ncbi:YIP1 family protein [Desulfurococcaceae archaeon MEX13E-LK6-19]|nr:YIP1 family protein [Desulfurococcaceae archaeon MEX13E-LK6-19]
MTGVPAFIEYFGTAVTAPRQFAKIVMAERKELYYGFAIVLVFSIMVSIVSTYAVVIKAMGFAPFLPGFVVSATLGGLVVLGVIASIILWLIIGLLVHGFSVLLGGKNGFEQTLMALSFFWIPWFIHGLAAPVYVFADYMTSLVIWMLVTIISLCWGVILVVLSLAEVHEYGVGRAFASILLPLVIIVFLCVIIPTLVVFSWI